MKAERERERVFAAARSGFTVLAYRTSDAGFFLEINSRIVCLVHYLTDTHTHTTQANILSR